MPAVAAKNTLAVVQANGLKMEEYWAKRLDAMIKLEQENFVFTNLGKKESIPYKQGTKNFSIRRYNHLPVGNHKLVEGVTPDSLKTEGHKVTGAIDQFGAFIELTDVADDIGFDSIKSVYQPELARHAAEVIERNVISKFTDGSEYYVGASSTDADDITGSDVLTFKDLRINALTMKLYHRKGHKKFKGKPAVVVAPNVMQDLLDSEDIEKKFLVPGNTNAPIKSGTLESYYIYGIYLMESLILTPKKNASNVNVYPTVMLGDDAYMVLDLGKGVTKWYNTGFTADKEDPLGQKATLGYKLWTGAKVKDPMTIIMIYSASAYDIDVDFTNDTIGRAANQNGGGSF